MFLNLFFFELRRRFSFSSRIIALCCFLQKLSAGIVALVFLISERIFWKIRIFGFFFKNLSFFSDTKEFFSSNWEWYFLFPLGLLMSVTSFGKWALELLLLSLLLAKEFFEKSRFVWVFFKNLSSQFFIFGEILDCEFESFRSFHILPVWNCYPFFLFLIFCFICQC